MKATRIARHHQADMMTVALDFELRAVRFSQAHMESSSGGR
jgi:hypothetical protein